MSFRKINPDQKYAQLFIDEVHWICLTSLAAQKEVSPDYLLGAILEACFKKLNMLDEHVKQDNPIKVELTLEPIREDRHFMDALLKERQLLDKERNMEERMVTPEAKSKLGWDTLES